MAITKAEFIEKRRVEAVRAATAARKAKQAMIQAAEDYARLEAESALAHDRWERSHQGESIAV